MSKNLLTTTDLSPRPSATEELTSTLRLTIKLADTAGTDLTVHYQPDRTVVPPADLADWLSKRASEHSGSAEAFVQAACDAFYDEILPKKVTFSLATQVETNTGTLVHRVQHSCKQPA